MQSLSPPSAAGKELDLYRIRPNTLHIGSGTAGLLGPSVGFGAGMADAEKHTIVLPNWLFSAAARRKITIRSSVSRAAPAGCQDINASKKRSDRVWLPPFLYRTACFGIIVCMLILHSFSETQMTRLCVEYAFFCKCLCITTIRKGELADCQLLLITKVVSSPLQKSGFTVTSSSLKSAGTSYEMTPLIFLPEATAPSSVEAPFTAAPLRL